MENTHKALLNCARCLILPKVESLALHVIRATTFSIHRHLAICFEAADCEHGGMRTQVTVADLGIILYSIDVTIT